MEKKQKDSPFVRTELQLLEIPYIQCKFSTVKHDSGNNPVESHNSEYAASWVNVCNLSKFLKNKIKSKYVRLTFELLLST